jgi:flavin reductase (DIM6/NTAB) family NADH-FMN oxidoreductase RutF
MAFNPDTFRKTMRLWATGVTIVTTAHEGVLRGLTVSSFTSVTLEPPLILVCLQKKTETAQLVAQSGIFAVCMLGEASAHLSDLFAGFTPTPAGVNRFDGLPLITASTGAPIFAEAMGWLDCRVHSVLDGSTHHIFMGEVLEASGGDESAPRPLLYYNRAYRKLAE